MDNEKDLKEELEISISEEENTVENENSDKNFDIEVKLQELYVKLDQLEIKLGTEDYTDEEYEDALRYYEDAEDMYAEEYIERMRG